MPSFALKGSAGAATNTVWMSPLADQLTMTNNRDVNRVVQPTSGPIRALNFANKFITVHTSLGSFTTAPDGTTNTAQHITEDNTNNIHSLDGAIVNANQLPLTRFAGIFKADTRTRIALCINDGSPNGYYVGFDLAGGQIAYAVQGFGLNPPNSFITIVGQNISQVAPNWYLCSVDFYALAPGTAVFFGAINTRVLLDNGSGTGAPSITFSGDGSSGVWGWKTSALPPDAWAISNTAFLDDFNDPTLANWDLNGTFADGFDWYTQAAVPGFFVTPFIPKANIVQSGSAVTINPTPPVGGGPAGVTAAVGGYGNPSDGRAKGAKGRNVWVPPFYWEFRYKVNYPAFPEVPGTNGNGEISITFGNTLEFADNFGQAAVHSGSPPFLQADGSKINWRINGWFPTIGDYGTTGYFPGCNLTVPITQITNSTFTQINSEAGPTNFCSNMWGLPQWTSGRGTSGSYATSAVVYDITAANFYFPNPNPGPTNEPPGAGWATFSYPASAAENDQPAVFTDLTQYQTFGYLVIPFNPATKSHGMLLAFGNGVYVGFMYWSPGNSPKNLPNGDPIIHTVDKQHLFMQIQTGLNTGSGWGPTIDYVKVIQ